jgi:hypothetical protein
MKYHELEAMIDGIRKAKGESLTALPTKTPAKPGQYPPRPIPSESIEDDDVVLHVPQKPAERVVKPPKKKSTEDSEDHGPVSPLPPHRSEPKIKSEKKTVHFCNCPACPDKKQK